MVRNQTPCAGTLVTCGDVQITVLLDVKSPVYSPMCCEEWTVGTKQTLSLLYVSSLSDEYQSPHQGEKNITAPWFGRLVLVIDC